MQNGAVTPSIGAFYVDKKRAIRYDRCWASPRCGQCRNKDRSLMSWCQPRNAWLCYACGGFTGMDVPKGRLPDRWALLQQEREAANNAASTKRTARSRRRSVPTTPPPELNADTHTLIIREDGIAVSTQIDWQGTKVKGGYVVPVAIDERRPMANRLSVKMADRKRFHDQQWVQRSYQDYIVVTRVG